ncbi:MAG: fumarylacetoacetate hydrolase family protein [Thermodesulfobacteria bacterium]|nr:fumarylacetoacetate hydrolase family protein [Thermodesulfobacteriota bacterium]
MRIVRALWQERPVYGVLEEERIKLLASFPEEGLDFTGEEVSFSQVKLLAPSSPSKIVALGLNYRDHARELGLPLPEEPLIFLKPPSAVIGPGEEIILPPESKRVDYEAELAIVIKRRARRVSPEEAFDYILGYTCFNDVTARDLQQKDGQWTRAKSFDTFAPFGPWIETGLDPSDLRVRSYLNGSLRQDSSTAELIFPVPEIVSFVSRVMTLEPGDLIATGTPPGIGPLAPGDGIEIEIEGVGRLKNYVRTSQEA